MDKITTYRYAYGDLGSIINGNFDGLRTATSMPELRLNRAVSKNLILPKVVGVYQGWELTREPNMEAHKGFKEMKDKIEDLAIWVIEMGEDVEDRFNKNLIHIGYDERIFPSKSIVRDALGEGSHRIRISPYDSMPDFGLKDVTELATIIEERNKKIDGIESMDEIIEASRGFAKEGYNALRGQLETYGLTRFEYGYLSKLERCMNFNSERKIVLPGCSKTAEAPRELLRGRPNLKIAHVEFEEGD